MMAFLMLLLLVSMLFSSVIAYKVCIVGGGISGASAAYFLHRDSAIDIEVDVYERNEQVGGRMALIELQGDYFEAGASILHPKNMHTLHFTKILGLNRSSSPDSEAFGIWNGEKFIFRTLDSGKSGISQKITSLLNNLSLLWRYKTSLFTMQNYVSRLLKRFLGFYSSNRLPYEDIKSLLQSVNLYEYSQHTLYDELLREGLSLRLITELVTVITRINYGQNVSISGLAGAVSLCGSGNGLWAVENGNWQMAKGLIQISNATLYLKEEVVSITGNQEMYQVTVTSGKVTDYDAVIIATALDESPIIFTPKLNLPKRTMHHTFATFVRGLLNPVYFGLKEDASLPDLVATLEIDGLPFISISVLKQYSRTDKAYKIFSRAALSEELLNKLFRSRNQTKTIDWAAYPEYEAPEVFAEIVLDEKHLYYVNAFENAASSMETSAVASYNVVRLILSRLQTSSLLSLNVQRDRTELKK